MKREATAKAEQQTSAHAVQPLTRSYGLRHDEHEPWTFHVVRVEGGKETVISRAPEQRALALAHLMDAVERDSWGAE